MATPAMTEMRFYITGIKWQKSDTGYACVNAACVMLGADAEPTVSASSTIDNGTLDLLFGASTAKQVTVPKKKKSSETCKSYQLRGVFPSTCHYMIYVTRHAKWSAKGNYYYVESIESFYPRPKCTWTIVARIIRMEVQSLSMALGQVKAHALRHWIWDADSGALDWRATLAYATRHNDRYFHELYWHTDYGRYFHWRWLNICQSSSHAYLVDEDNCAEDDFELSKESRELAARHVPLPKVNLKLACLWIGKFFDTQKPWRCCFNKYMREFKLKPWSYEMMVYKWRQYACDDAWQGDRTVYHTVRIMCALEEHTRQGHTCIELDALKRQLLPPNSAAKNDAAEWDAAVDELVKEELVVIDVKRGVMYTEAQYLAESEVVAKLCTQFLVPVHAMPHQCHMRSDAGDCYIDMEHDRPLTKVQRDAFMHMQSHALTILTGMPGTGKSEVIARACGHFARPLVCSFVGRMVSSLRTRIDDSHTQPQHAFTIHHLLEQLRIATESNDVRRQQWFASFDVLIVDEASNIDLDLFNRLLAINDLNGCWQRILLVGDPYQCPPIDSGNVLNDLIRAFPRCVFECVENKRSEGRLLFDNALALKENRLDDVRFFMLSDTASMSDGTLDDCETSVFISLPSRSMTFWTWRDHMMKLIRHYSNLHHMQYITFDNRTVKLINKWHDMAHQHIDEFYVGQKVTFRDNRRQQSSSQWPYDSDGVMNGDVEFISCILDVNPLSKEELVLKQCSRKKFNRGAPWLRYLCFESGKRVLFSRETMAPWDVLSGVAMTVHKKMGNEDDVICFVLPYQSNEEEDKDREARYASLWSKAVLFVAMTRARKRLVVVGDLQFFHQLASKPYPARDSRMWQRLECHQTLAEQRVDTSREVPPIDLPQTKAPSSMSVKDELVDVNDATKPVLKRRRKKQKTAGADKQHRKK